ncbi:MAG: helix-turn-helix transcriptional regulator [Devosia sp.]|nr:helix-turn-helix transcriptional regulator [Devosia sp.]
MRRASEGRTLAGGAGASGIVEPNGTFGDLRQLLASFCPDWRGASLAVDTNGLGLLYANAHAHDMLQHGRPARLSNGRLVICPDQAMRRLHAMLEALREGTTHTAPLVVDDEDAAATYVLRIALPMSPHLPHIAIIDITRALVDPHPALLGAIAEAFHLTVAEGNVLGHLAAGLSLREIAAMRGVRLETVRQQCKVLLSKMRCRRQADLVRVVAGLSHREPAQAAC